jgi:type IV pilus assembly protein PilC
MPKYTYTGENREGGKVEETVEAADRYAVYEIARTAGHTVNAISEHSRLSMKRFFNKEKLESIISRVSGDDLVMLTRNLSSMLKAGLPLTRALSVIERQSSNPKLKGVLTDVRSRIQKGDAFNESLMAHPKVFDNLYTSMVRAGEEGGSLVDTLRVLSIQMERSSSLRKKIKGAMMYPAIVLTIMCVIGILMMIYVMPSITGTFKELDVDLPSTTVVLISMSDFMVANTMLVLAGMVGFIFGFLYFLRTKLGKIIFHYIFIHLPVIGTMVKETNSARASRTLSSLLSSGVDVLRALQITEDVVQNVYYKPVLKEAANNVEKGNPLSDAFVKRPDLFPVFVGEMIMVGEETGQISQMLEQLAVFYEDEVEHKTKDLSTIIEPLLMVFIGGSVGFFALAMIAPIYSIGDSL